MKINNELNNDLKRIEQKQKNLLVVRENELEAANKLYDKKMAVARVDGDEKLAQLRDQNQLEIANEAQYKEETIQKYRKQLNDTRSMLEREQETLGQLHQDKVKNINEVYENKYQEQHELAIEKGRELNFEAEQSIRKMHTDIEQKKQNAYIQAKSRSDSEASSQKLENTRALDNLKHLSNNQDREYATVLAKKELDHKVAVDQMVKNNSRELGQRDQAFKGELAFKEEQYIQGYSGLDKAYKEKYAERVRLQEESLVNLEKSFNKQVQQKIEEYSNKKKNIDDKGQDEFYRLSKIEPMVSHTDKETIVSIVVPEHEKDTVILNAQGRKIKISHSRSFEQRQVEDDGSVNNTRKSEVYAKSFDVPDLLNSKKVVQNYENGILSFKIAKL